MMAGTTTAILHYKGKKKSRNPLNFSSVIFSGLSQQMHQQLCTSYDKKVKHL
jgi:hypothetical protein